MSTPQVGRLAIDEYLRVLAPPKQDAAGGTVRAEGEPVAGPGKVGVFWGGSYVLWGYLPPRQLPKKAKPQKHTQLE